MPPEWKPDRARFVLSIYPANGFIYGQVDPGSPGRMAKSALLRRPACDGENAARTEAPRHYVRWRSGDACHARRALAARQNDSRRQFPHRTGLRSERPNMAGHENMKTIVRLSLGLGVSIALVAPALAELAMTGAPVAMRAGPSGKAGVVQRIPQSAEIELLKCARGWCHASWRGRFGYIPEETVVLGPPPATLPGDEMPPPVRQCVSPPMSRPRRGDGRAPILASAGVSARAPGSAESSPRSGAGPTHGRRPALYDWLIPFSSRR